MMKIFDFNKLRLWKILLPLLAIANLTYLPKDIFGWAVTLSFFLLVPGYLLLSRLQHNIKSRWEIASFSLGLSLLILMVSGLALNSLHTFGLTRPLTTLNIFISLDVVTVALLALNKNKHVKLSKPQLHASTEQIAASIALTLLPLLAISGAVRLNNGGSNILTIILFATIPVLFMLLMWRKGLKPLYPYAILMFGMAVLLSTSLRGWYITGHDIRYEFLVFQSTFTNEYWSTAIQSGAQHGNPYNACLSITILPTIIDKLTSLPVVYIYKALFQVIFAFAVVTVFSFIKRLKGSRTALLGSFVFISFPTFYNDMPFLNRQEMAFVFFALLILVSFMDMARQPKTLLTVSCLLGIVLSHYSSSYVTIGILLISWGVYKFLMYRKNRPHGSALPVISFPILIAILLFTFFWNAQLTLSSSNLSNAVKATVQTMLGETSDQPGIVRYNILKPTSPPLPQELFAKYSSKSTTDANYVTPYTSPLTTLGNSVSHIVNVSELSGTINAWLMKSFELLALLGFIIYLLHYKKTSNDSPYLLALLVSCLALLILFTLIPALSSADYSILRLFQQTLVITAIVVVFALQSLFGFLGRYKVYLATIYLAFLFANLSGFIPSIVGGNSPSLAFANAGGYYDFYYIHKSDTLAGRWLSTNQNNDSVAVDSNAYAPFLTNTTPIDLANNNARDYLFQDYTDVHNNTYSIFINGTGIEYSDPGLTIGRNLLYFSQSDKVYGARQ